MLSKCYIAWSSGEQKHFKFPESIKQLMGQLENRRYKTIWGLLCKGGKQHKPLVRFSWWRYWCTTTSSKRITATSNTTRCWWGWRWWLHGWCTYLTSCRCVRHRCCRQRQWHITVIEFFRTRRDRNRWTIWTFGWNWGTVTITVVYHKNTKRRDIYKK